MLQGESVRLHRDTVCYLHRPGDEALDGAQCIVVRFDAERRKWRVRVEGGKELLVPEASLQLGHAIVTSSVRGTQLYVNFAQEDAQGSCGRGLTVAQPVQAGTLLFQESPAIVIGSLGDSSGARAHLERWRRRHLRKCKA